MASGFARSGFDIDLRDGQAREEAFSRVIGECTIEHKRDHLAGKTGNVFIEFRQKGRPSGIAVTTAEYWAIEYLECRWLIVRTDELKEIARNIWKTMRTRRKRGGDFNAYEGVLVPLTALLASGGIQ